MKAMIFAAGLGTRLRPLTNNLPKALVEYNGKPLLQILIEKLIQYNFSEIVINVHHFADKIINFLDKNNNFGLKIYISDEKGKLLETGGGLFHARYFFNSNENFLVHNADIISELNFDKIIQYHTKNNAIATLAVQDRISSKRLYFNEQKQLCKWRNEKTGEEKIATNCQKSFPKAFSGIQVINSNIFKYMHYGKYSIIDTYLQVAKYEKIIFFDHSGDAWKDMGRPENFIN